MSKLVVSQKIKLAVKNGHGVVKIKVGNTTIGGDQLTVMAGPCSVENREQILEAARIVKGAGGRILRGGAFKPRTLPYSFQGLGEEGLKILDAARSETGLPIITEVMAPEDVELVESYADILQIGARNMQNFTLLKRVGKASKPVMLKRGMSATIEEWLGCAEYILNEGNHDVVLCERGIRTYETITRNTLDVSAVPVIKQLSDLPVVVDPSHGTGIRSLVAPMAKAGIAAGADGLMIEMHPHPEKALSDGDQSLYPHEFEALMREMAPIAGAVGKRL
jgi:3-deoxy-7-phosphoheptulonate synthase